MAKLQPRNNTFAYFSYPITSGCLKAVWPLSRIIPPSFLARPGTSKFFPLQCIKDAQGNEAQGYFITRYYPQERFLKDSPNVKPLDDILAAAEIAQRLGAGILGVGGFPATVGDELRAISKKISIPIASGNALSAWSIFETIYWACRQKKIELSRTRCVVLGAASSLGALCSRKLSAHVAKVTLCDEDGVFLKALKEKIAGTSPAAALAIEQDSRKAAKDADIVVACDSKGEYFFNAEDLMPGGIICDVSWCGSHAARLKPSHGCTVLKSGLVKLPKNNNFLFDVDMGDNIICASMAEVILLTMENKFFPFTSGSEANLETLEDVADIAARHGFEIWFSEKLP